MSRVLAAAAVLALVAVAGCGSADGGRATDAGRAPSGGPTGGAAARPSGGPSDEATSAAPTADSPSHGPATPGHPSAGPGRTRAPAPVPSGTAATAGTAAGAAGPSRPAGRWQPRPGTSWQWQLGGRIDLDVDAQVYDIDGFENDAATVAALHARGRKVICYINVGAWEDYRPDADAFPASVRGNGNGWEGERTLDIRRTDVLLPIMAKRFDMCRAKGFDAVEPDLVENHHEKSGFPLTAAQQLAYNRAIAALAHQRGLAVGLKNDLDQIPQLVGVFDFAVNEQCAEYDECDRLVPFVSAGKAVFNAEYNVPPERFCADSRRLGISAMAKRLELGAWRQPC
ncbi:endo alpha-1,4 polygalactosaminidase [Peterkaempfera bronchialis]|uniref:endo alpha-1,4 polygalactosaminidase n=1 Tax=Peterkaempfera bronchialis TaxID=2126346 RepID=UPI001E5D797F|nr:endo alpha-1,4 polygalactosaminidase [Peterkaempfera bronchialis]